MNGAWFAISVVMCLAMVIAIIASYSTTVTTDSDQTSKLLGVVIGTAIATAVPCYGISMWLFKGNPSMLLHFLLAVMLIVIMPMSVVSASLSTAQLNELRNTVAVRDQ
jgi:cytochrome bd-type quinol oxidase subunit 2